MVSNQKLQRTSRFLIEKRQFVSSYQLAISNYTQQPKVYVKFYITEWQGGTHRHERSCLVNGSMSEVTAVGLQDSVPAHDLLALLCLGPWDQVVDKDT